MLTEKDQESFPVQYFEVHLDLLNHDNSKKRRLIMCYSTL